MPAPRYRPRAEALRVDDGCCRITDRRNLSSTSTLGSNRSSRQPRLSAIHDAAVVVAHQVSTIGEPCPEVMASCARQANDDELFKMARRIQTRAIRRCGELLKQIDGRGRPPEIRGGTPPNLSQRKAAEKAGLSKDQQKQAVRVARIPDDEFNKAVESDNPPSVTDLDEMGKASSRLGPRGRSRRGSATGTAYLRT